MKLQRAPRWGARGWVCAASAGLLALAVPGAHAELPDPVRFGVAVEIGDLASAREWLDAGLPPDFLADRVGTGLMIAAWEGNIPMMALFLSRGADINATNALDEQALMHAAWKGRFDVVRWLLERGARVNRDGLEWSALHYAVFAGHEPVARLLLEHGADIDARSTNGSSPLMMAAREGRADLAKLLLTVGADARLTNDWGDDALAWAMRYGHARIGKMVAGHGEFAAAARQPASFGPPTRSLPPESKLDALYRRMRAAEELGYQTRELEQEYLDTLGELREQWAAENSASTASRRDAPAALEIRARRDAPGREEALLIYDRPPAARTPQPAARELGP